MAPACQKTELGGEAGAASALGVDPGEVESQGCVREGATRAACLTLCAEERDLSAVEEEAVEIPRHADFPADTV